MVAVSNPSMDQFDDCGPQAGDLLAFATEEVEFFFDCLVQAISEPIDQYQEVSASGVASNSAVQQTEADVVDTFVLVGEATASSVSSVQIELLELLEPDRTDADTTRAMEGLLEFVAREEHTCPTEDANLSELARLRQVNTQLAQRLLQLEEQCQMSDLRQLSAEAIAKVNHLEERLDASHEQLTQILTQTSQILTLQATETRCKEKSKKQFFALALAGLAVLGGLGVSVLSRTRQQGDRAAASEVQRAIVLLNQMDGMALSATFDAGNVTITGIAPQTAGLEEMARTFGRIPGVKTVTNTIEIASPAISTRVYFEVNSATVVSPDLDAKLRPIQQVMQQYPQLQLKIIGHAHGGERANGRSHLARERAQAVQTLLVKLGLERRRTLALSRPGPPPNVAPNSQPWLSQCVRFETTMGDRS